MSKPKTLLTVEVGSAGVNRIISRPRTIAEANECSRLVALTTLPLRLLHDAIREASGEQLVAEPPRPEIYQE
jgi:hypothetical protein